MNKVAKWTLAIVATLLVVALAAWGYQASGLGALLKDPELLRSKVAATGGWAPLLYIGLQLMQVIIAPIPGSVTTLVGGMLFGFWPAIGYSLIAIFLGSAAAFAMARKWGLPLIRRLMGEDKVAHYQGLLQGRQTTALAMMFLLQVFPDDLLCFLAGLTNLSFAKFCVLVVVTRPWGLIVSAYIGAHALSLTTGTQIALGAALVVLCVVMWKLGPKLEAVFTRWVRKLTRKEELP